MLEALDRDAYYRSLAGNPNARFPQLWDYEAARGDGCRFEAVRTSNGGLALVRLRTVLGRGLAYVSSGPTMPEANATADEISLALGEVLEEYAKRRRLLLRVVPPLVPTQTDAFCTALSAQGFHSIRGGPVYRTFLVNVCTEPENTKAAFKKRLRYGVNRGLRNQFVVDSGTSLGLYDRFLALYTAMRERKDFDTGVDPSWVRQIQQRLPENFKLHVRVARLGDEDMAATVHAAIGDTVVYLLGATHVEQNQPPERLYAAHTLHWDVILAATSVGARWYDLGGIDPDENPGGYTFKEAFGGDDVSGLGAWEAGSALGSRFLVGLGERIRKHAR